MKRYDDIHAFTTHFKNTVIFTQVLTKTMHCVNAELIKKHRDSWIDKSIDLGIEELTHINM